MVHMSYHQRFPSGIDHVRVHGSLVQLARHRIPVQVHRWIPYHIRPNSLVRYSSSWLTTFRLYQDIPFANANLHRTCDTSKACQ